MMTLSKIAKLANVSLSTASKAFSGSSEVNEETRQMIYEIAKEHGCFKKFYNAKYPKLVLAVIIPEFDSIYYTRYLSAIQENLDKSTWEICVSTTNFSEETERHLLDYYYKHANADAIILIGAKVSLAEQYEIPVVFIEPSTPQQYGITVSGDSSPAVWQALVYLKNNGIQTLGFIGESLTNKRRQRIVGSARELGLDIKDEWVHTSRKRFAPGGYEAMAQMLCAGKLPRAVVCAYDYMAMGAIRCLLDHGLRVPEDVAVLGFDDIPEAEFYNPPLASISSSTQAICALAASAITKQLAGEAVEQTQKAASRFYLRRSFKITPEE